MNELRDLLEEKGLRRAVIIDDGVDDTPRCNDLDDGDWAVFFTDLSEADRDFLSRRYPDYKTTNPEDLQKDQKFVDFLWEERSQFPGSAPADLFSDCESRKATEREALDELSKKLRNLGLSCELMGREPGESAKQADIIFIDLFFSPEQSSDDMAEAVRAVNKIVVDRVDPPPLVVLMSSSRRIYDLRNRFRDDAELFGSTFRVISKQDLAENGRLDNLLTRLANHYEDAKRAAAFIHAWDIGLTSARKEFLRILRCLDLTDYAKVKSLVVDPEDSQLGQYLLDVADRVLQHEIEASEKTIKAAKRLNKIELANYPAPHLTGSPDLQNLVHRMIFQHGERMQLSCDGRKPKKIQFGDVLRRRDEDDVYLVVTPACDLERGGNEHILVLPGTLRRLSTADWTYGETRIPKTPVVVIDDENRYWIEWNLKGRRTFCLSRLCDDLEDGKTLERLGRMREIYATEIQQRMLANMGRIGMPSNLPATFPVSLTLFAVSPSKAMVPVDVDLNEGVCYVGRCGKVDLVLVEDACDALKYTVQNYPSENVHPYARDSLEALKSDSEFFQRFESGKIEVPKMSGQPKPVNSNGKVYMYISRRSDDDEEADAKVKSLNAPFVLKVSDPPKTDEQ